MPQTQLKALWCALDLDESNSIQKDEMARFFKRGTAGAPKPKPAALQKQHTSAALVGDIARVGTSGAIACQPTAEMKAELEAAGIPVPDDAALTELSVTYNKWLEELRQKEGKDQSHSWIQLFSAVDKGGLAMPRPSTPADLIAALGARARATRSAVCHARAHVPHAQPCVIRTLTPLVLVRARSCLTYTRARRRFGLHHVRRAGGDRASPELFPTACTHR